MNMKNNRLLQAVNEANERLAKARAKIDKKRLGKRIRSHTDLDDAARYKMSVACPYRGLIHPAAWVLNMNYTAVCNMIETGLFIYNRKVTK